MSPPGGAILQGTARRSRTVLLRDDWRDAVAVGSRPQRQPAVEIRVGRCDEEDRRQRCRIVGRVGGSERGDSLSELRERGRVEENEIQLASHAWRAFAFEGHAARRKAGAVEAGLPRGGGKRIERAGAGKRSLEFL